MHGVPVFAGPRLLEFATGRRLQQLVEAPNAEVVVRRRDQVIVQINLAEAGDDSDWQPEHPRANPRRYAHDHENEQNPRGVWTLRHLQAADRVLYCLSVLDCVRRRP